MFGRRPRLPIDLLFPMVRQDAVQGVNKYVSTLYEHLKRATSLAHVPRLIKKLKGLREFMTDELELSHFALVTKY